MELYNFFTASGINNSFSGYGPHPFFCDYCPQLSDLPDGKFSPRQRVLKIKSHFSHKKLTVLAGGGQGMSKSAREMDLKFGFRSLLELLNGSRTPAMNSTQSGAVGGTTWGPFLRVYSLQLPHRCTGRPVCCREPQIGNDEACILPPSSS